MHYQRGETQAVSGSTTVTLTKVLYMFKEIMLKLTCIGLQVLWGHHDNKADCPFIAKHLIGPAADGTHALHSCNAVVGDKHLERQDSLQLLVELCCSYKLKYLIYNV